jgi:trimethylamine:corrinoid methyltransferase-like protein
MRLSRMTVLSEQEIKKIHDATPDVFDYCGVKSVSDEMLSFLKNQGPQH